MSPPLQRLPRPEAKLITGFWCSRGTARHLPNSLIIPDADLRVYQSWVWGKRRVHCGCSEKLRCSRWCSTRLYHMKGLLLRFLLHLFCVSVGVCACVCMFVYVSTCHGANIQVRGPLLGVSFLLPPCRSWDFTIQAWWRAPLPAELSCQSHCKLFI